MASELHMGLQYLLVNFAGSRSVLADDVPVGVTNRILLIAPGIYTITLDGAPTNPPSQDVTLAATSVATPAVVTFA
jgi:hypothetical protein